MQVLQLEAGRHLYGGPRQVLLLMEGLRAAGVASPLVAPAGSAIASAAKARGFAVHEIPFGGDLDIAAAGRLYSLLRRLRPDLLHVHSRRGADYFGAAAARLAGIAAVLTRRVDNPEPLLAGWLKNRSYARVVAISTAVQARLLAQGLPAASLSLIPSAVDVQACQPVWTRSELLAAFALPADAVLVGVVAQLIPRKGHAGLLAVWPAIRAACPQARLLLFGRGPLDERLRTLAGDDQSIIFAGWRADLHAFLGRLDLLVHPVLAEGLGLAVLEAQAAGVPVVALASGGVAEALADGESGLLVPAGDADALQAAISALLADPVRRAALGAGGPEFVRQRFSVPAMANAYLQLYRSIAGVEQAHAAD